MKQLDFKYPDLIWNDQEDREYMDFAFTDKMTISRKMLGTGFRCTGINRDPYLVMIREGFFWIGAFTDFEYRHTFRMVKTDIRYHDDVELMGIK